MSVESQDMMVNLLTNSEKKRLFWSVLLFTVDIYTCKSTTLTEKRCLFSLM